jgi:hypothetical protein
MKVRKFNVSSNTEKLFLMADIAYRYCNDVAMMDIAKLHHALCRGYHLEEGEIFQRPRITLETGGDCDDASIAFVSWAVAQPRYIPWMLETCGLKSATHVTTYLCLNGLWKNLDTLPYEWPKGMRPFQRLTRSEYERDTKSKYL